MCHSRAVSASRTRPRLMQSQGALAGAGLSALVTSLLLVLKFVQFHLLGVFPTQHGRSCSHSFCTHLIKKFSLASSTLVNWHLWGRRHMGAGTVSMFTAVAITQWPCASLPRGNWGDNKRLLVALVIPALICDWEGPKWNAHHRYRASLPYAAPCQLLTGRGINALTNVLGCALTCEFDSITNHCCSPAKPHPAHPQHIVFWPAMQR